jgi:hypothetical protein
MPTLPCHCAHCALTSLSFPSRAVAFPSLFPVPIPCPLCPHIALPVISLAAHRPLFGRMTLFLLTALSFPCPWSYCTLSSLPFLFPHCPVHVFALTSISLPSLCSHVPPIALRLLSLSSHCPASTLTASQWPLLVVTALSLPSICAAYPVIALSLPSQCPLFALADPQSLTVSHFPVFSMPTTRGSC